MALPSLSSPLSSPLVRDTLLGFWISLDSRQRGARVPRTIIKRHANRAVLHDFSAPKILAFSSLLSPPLVSSVLWPTPLATATTGSTSTAIPERITRSMGHGRRPRRCQTRTRVQFATGTVRPTRSIYVCTGTRAGEITTRAVRRWTPATRTLVSRASTKAILKLRCVAFQRARPFYFLNYWMALISPAAGSWRPVWAHLGLILACFGSFWLILAHFGSFILAHFDVHRGVLFAAALPRRRQPRFRTRPRRPVPRRR